MFLDIDHFKAINDSLGHAAGDAVLKEFAKRLQKSVRGTDTVARLAGDEFVVILEGLHDANVVTLIADKIIAEMNAPFVVDQHILKVTTSVGISHHDASEGDITPGALLERADKALYEAKSAGRNVHRMA
jgi:diguanylate cyclase (GGDEF)-like protein